MGTILIADDEIKYRRLVKMFLENKGFTVFDAEDGEKLLSLFPQHLDCELVVLDVMMPNLDGYETCKAIREISDVPILMLTALSDVSSEVNGFNHGADDYISKPFTNEVFIARVNALLRRNMVKEEAVLKDEGLELHEKLYLVKDGVLEYKLTKKEYYLIEKLVLNKNQILTREQLLSSIWGYDYEGDPRTLDTHIKSLRSKIGELSKLVITAKGKGYYYKGR